MSSLEEIFDADDAQLAQFQRRQPRAWARYLMTLNSEQRADMQRRLTHGQAQLARHDAALRALAEPATEPQAEA
jgi:hypothetical protein